MCFVVVESSVLLRGLKKCVFAYDKILSSWDDYDWQDITIQLLINTRVKTDQTIQDNVLISRCGFQAMNICAAAYEQPKVGATYPSDLGQEKALMECTVLSQSPLCFITNWKGM